MNSLVSELHHTKRSWYQPLSFVVPNEDLFG